jgi:redox-sensing transcriptional repressor
MLFLWYIDCEKKDNMDKKIPLPVLIRLSSLYEHLGRKKMQGITNVSSAELGGALGQTAHSIRKDINFLGVAGTAGAKYAIDDLLTLLRGHLGFERPKKCCIVGLGRLGCALLEHLLSQDRNSVTMVAGFESNINRLETIQSPVALFPAYRIEEVVAQLQVELAILAVSPKNAQDVADRCMDGGVTGILNFTPTVIKPKNEKVFVRSIDISGELRILSALLYTSNDN